MSILDGFATSMLIFTPVVIDDVPEIHELRTTRKKNYLVQIHQSIENQYKYFYEYKKTIHVEEFNDAVAQRICKVKLDGSGEVLPAIDDSKSLKTNFKINY